MFNKHFLLFAWSKSKPVFKQEAEVNSKQVTGTHYHGGKAHSNDCKGRLVDSLPWQSSAS